MKTGYPRFFIHKSIQKLASTILSKFGQHGEEAMLFPTPCVAARCRQFIKATSQTTPAPAIRIVEFVSKTGKRNGGDERPIWSDLCAVMYPASEAKVSKQFWQHTGDGVSSRRAEFCQREFDEGLLVEKSTITIESPPRMSKGPKRYSRGNIPFKQPAQEDEELDTFVEERFGRNLDLAFVDSAKLAIRRRIAGSLKTNVEVKDALELSSEGGRMVEGFAENDVYLHPTGMSAIFNTHRLLMATLGPKKSVCYGFPYIDTLKILEKFGPGCHFYGHGSSEELDDLEQKLESGERILALFCEFPSNPLLKAPDLQRIKSLADKYDFATVIDETVGNFLNVHVLPHADVVVSSLTKVFSGDSNVMGGSAVLNPKGRYYKQLKEALTTDFEDNHWSEDVLFLERNSRDFVSRIERINKNAEAVADLLKSHPRIKQVYHPKYSPTRPFYDNCRSPSGGYGGLLSVTFYTIQDAIEFFDTLEISKGPSLGTNFTLASPYTLLAHYGELDWAAGYGVEDNLVRVSVGLEETGELVERFKTALKAL
ncbi:PLP-dependent transferase [Choiromyces venosus 120613-1]|uniref:cystathionine gamma-synthase n=1 Tax=Choiromyces venosus 120613-1 TaxID=1336337 RepID=A0A3N4K2L1_9PEZI|nr:PLP-dependent transferase [Choiromyces venosus 120613-1]